MRAGRWKLVGLTLTFGMALLCGAFGIQSQPTSTAQSSSSEAQSPPAQKSASESQSSAQTSGAIAEAQNSKTDSAQDERQKRLLDWLVLLATAVGVVATIFLAKYAKSTDRAYHKIAEIEGQLANIAQRQLDIMAAAEEPILQARVAAVMNPNTQTYDSDHLMIENVGTPVTEIEVRTAEIFSIRFWNVPNTVIRQFGTIGYYPYNWPDRTGNKIFDTGPSTYRSLVFQLHVPSEHEFNGYKVLVDFQQYVRIKYSTRTTPARQRWYAVSEFGSVEKPEEAQKAFATVEESMRDGTVFVFYQMTADDFWKIVQQVAPPAQG
jgi:hypothetical protein